MRQWDETGRDMQPRRRRLSRARAGRRCRWLYRRRSMSLPTLRSTPMPGSLHGRDQRLNGSSRCESFGVNAFFVRRDLTTDRLREVSMGEGYRRGRFRAARDRRGRLAYRTAEEEAAIIAPGAGRRRRVTIASSGRGRVCLKTRPLLVRLIQALVYPVVGRARPVSNDVDSSQSRLRKRALDMTQVGATGLHLD